MKEVNQRSLSPNDFSHLNVLLKVDQRLIALCKELLSALYKSYDVAVKCFFIDERIFVQTSGKCSAPRRYKVLSLFQKIAQRSILMGAF